MLTKNATMSKKVVMERLALIKERHNRLVLRQRQEIEREIQEGAAVEEDYAPEADTGEVVEFVTEDEE